MSVARKPPSVQFALQLAETKPQFELSTVFQQGIPTSGRWSITHSKGENGLSLYPTYDGKPVSITVWSMFYCSFDFNLYNNKPTPTAKFSGCTILPSSVSPKTKEVISSSLGQLLSNQQVIKRVIEAYGNANREVFTQKYNSAGEMEPVVVKVGPVAVKMTKVSPNKPDSKPCGYHSVGISLRVEKDLQKPDLQRMVTTTIILDGKCISPITRADLYNRLKGKQFVLKATTELRGFDGTQGTFLTLHAESVQLLQVQKKSALTKEETQRLEAESTALFEQLGLASTSSSTEEKEPVVDESMFTEVGLETPTQ